MTAPPGWYPSPGGSGQRWWDGSAWGPEAPPPAPAAPPPTQPLSTPDDATVKGAALVVIAGALIATIGSFLAWVSVDTSFGTVSRSGFQDGRDGPYVLILAIIAVLAAAARMTGWKLPGLIRNGAGIIDGLIITGLGIADTASVYHRIHESQFTGEGIHGSVGVGLYLVIIGGAVITIAAVFGIGGWSRAKANVFAGFGSNPPIAKGE